MAALLELENVTARYGPVEALHGISLTVARARSPRCSAPTGRARRRRCARSPGRCGGTARSDSRQPAGPHRPDAAARLGIAHVPEGRGTFAELTVWENLRLGAYTRRGARKDDFARVQTYFPWLDDRRTSRPGR